MTSLFETLNSIPLDPRSERDLVSEAQLVAFNKSNGKLNDFSVGSPLAALIEAQAFCGSELLFYANKLIPALTIEFYKNVGIERRLGTPSVVTLTFELEATQSNPFYIPKAFQIKTIDGEVIFRTDEQLAIPAGQLTGSVTATSITVGTTQNVAANSINVITQPLTNLKSVTNNQASQGGSETETLEEVIERGNLAIRTRGLVSGDDYERSAEAVIGLGSRFKAVGNLGTNKKDYVLGTVHLFGLDESGAGITPAQRSAVYDALQPQTHVSTSLVISPVEVKDVYVEAEVVIQNNSNAVTVGKSIWENLYNYLSSKFFTIGKSVSITEVEYVIRDTPNVVKWNTVTLDGTTEDVEVVQQYVVANIKQLTLTIKGEDGAVLLTNVYFEGSI